ncbi:transglutaminase [Sporosarcina sp. PTS2304]|uniref:transglutaminase domain-containing protein n=1 Tax=Sporosarcina sp. PTS2304 TaxID=2283194 RepID=UPI000E0D267B|nr:transglutaminase domain-containing protein [Sporosarcina sp. PTS2304]AXI00077.1 transglutaminase [Sporosarcina sp. PTS2304]
MMKKSRLNRKALMFLFGLSIVLLWEWFIPIMHLTDFGHASLFFIYLLLFFILALVNVAWWISASVQVLYILWAIHYIYFGQLPFSFDTFSMFVVEMKQNILLVVQGEVSELSNMFRTFLLFVLLWMIAYLIRYWIEVRHSMMMFFVLTVLFVALLDTFSPYDGSASIIRIMIIGLLLVGFVTLLRLMSEAGVSIRSKRLLRLSLPLLLLVLLVGLFAKSAPVHPPAWPDPVPYLLSLAGVGKDEQGKGVSKAGYDPDDSQLGGAFVQDHQLVFEAAVEKRQYWRIETKDTYTSKGWIQNEEEETEILRTNENLWGSETVKPSYARLQFSEKLPFLVMPYGTKKLLYPEPLSIMHEIAANRLYLLMGVQEELLQYEVEYVTPVYTLSELRRPEMLAFETVPENLNSYMQLPENLPQRVKDLAQSITENEISVYDKVKAVEQYFKRNGFTYETQNVAVPDDTQDYVDQFLFDTKKGYCDNFSTSMAVMLRSAGIPTRWVKGFAPGELSYKASGKSVYRVTNDEAHSWVEAYIPEFGWIPFEPTIGFTHPTDIRMDVKEPAEQEQIVKQPEKPKADKDQSVQKSSSSLQLVQKIKESVIWFFTQWWVYGAFMLVLAVGMILIYRRRKYWLPKWAVRKLRKQADGWQKFEQQYNQLLRQLHRAGIPKEAGMTLSHYAKIVDEKYGSDRMRLLTRSYEEGIYGNDRHSHEWHKLNKVWEDLIINTIC